jgi:hypothetical protein
MVRWQSFGIVGLSLANEDRTGDLAALIHDIRRSSRNRRLGVMVGGQCFTDRPDLSALVGADATASAAQQTVLTAETLLSMRRWLSDPRGLAPWYNGAGVTLFVAGMMACSVALQP